MHTIIKKMKAKVLLTGLLVALHIELGLLCPCHKQKLDTYECCLLFTRKPGMGPKSVLFTQVFNSKLAKTLLAHPVYGLD